MNGTGGNQPNSAIGFAASSVLAILAGVWPAKAQTCPTGTAVPLQTIKIFNDTADYVFAELEVGLNNPDQWIQMACNITQTQAKTFTYATTLTNRFYINGDKGIAPGGSVVITLPLYTQLAATVDPTKPNQYAEWWQGQNMQIFTSPTATPPLAYQNSFSGAARPDQKPLLSAAAKPTWPTCVDQTGAPPAAATPSSPMTKARCQSMARASWSKPLSARHRCKTWSRIPCRLRSTRPTPIST